MKNKAKKNIKRLYNILKRRSVKRGIWFKELAEKAGLSRHNCWYYFFGFGNKGGYLKGKVEIVRKQGKNIFIRLKEEK